MSIYDEFRTLATDLLSTSDFGVAATLVRVTQGYDKHTRSTTNTTSNVPCTAAIRTLRFRDDQGREVVETQATLTAEPQTGDKLAVNGETYRVLETETVAPDGTAIVYKAMVTK